MIKQKVKKYKESIILGIDPGTHIIGFGFIKSNSKSAKFIENGEFVLEEFKTTNLKLKKIFEIIIDLIAKYLPTELAIETNFLGKNIQSTIKLSLVQGIILAAVFYKQLKITEYSPKKIKRAITGTGNASKEQVASMLKKILDIKKKDFKKYIDANDGLAIAVCHHLNYFHYNFLINYFSKSTN